MSTALAAEFREGELVEWVTVGRMSIGQPGTGPEFNSRSIRPVVFEGLEGATHARIRFGQQNYQVRLSELRRHPGPAPLLDYLKPPPGFTPNSWGSRRQPLDALRTRLRQAQEHAAQTSEAVSAAKELADRAEAALKDARAALAAFAEADQAAADDLVAALRAGRPAPGQTGTAALARQEAAKRRCTAAEAAAAQLAAELSAARAPAQEADRQVRAAAREGDKLTEIEAEAARLRAELHALASYWPPPAPGDRPAALTLSQDLAGLLANPPAQIVDLPLTQQGQGRQRPWADLYERLLTDADAEL
jgi:hypothetical protein